MADEGSSSVIEDPSKPGPSSALYDFDYPGWPRVRNKAIDKLLASLQNTEEPTQHAATSTVSDSDDDNDFGDEDDEKGAFGEFEYKEPLFEDGELDDFIKSIPLGTPVKAEDFGGKTGIWVLGNYYDLKTKSFNYNKKPPKTDIDKVAAPSATPKNVEEKYDESPFSSTTSLENNDACDGDDDEDVANDEPFDWDKAFQVAFDKVLQDEEDARREEKRRKKREAKLRRRQEEAEEEDEGIELDTSANSEGSEPSAPTLNPAQDKATYSSTSAPSAEAINLTPASSPRPVSIVAPIVSTPSSAQPDTKSTPPKHIDAASQPTESILKLGQEAALLEALKMHAIKVLPIVDTSLIEPPRLDFLKPAPPTTPASPHIAAPAWPTASGSSASPHVAAPTSPGPPATSVCNCSPPAPQAEQICSSEEPSLWTTIYNLL